MSLHPTPFHELVESRRSVRRYRPDPIPPETLDAMLRAAQRAPTGAALQLYSFVRITDPDLRDRIATLAGDQRHVREAPEFLVICADTHRIERLLAHRGSESGIGPTMALFYGLIDATLAAAYLALAAEAMGYGTCFIGGIQNHLDEVARLLRLPRRVIPLVGLCIGRPAEEPPRKPRLPLAAILHENGYREPTPALLEESYRVMAAATRSGDWYNVLCKYGASGGVMERREAVLHRALIQQGFR